MDPLAATFALLRPRAVAPKVITGAGRSGVRYGPFEDVGYGLVLAGQCRLQLTGGSVLQASAGDFVLLPPAPGFRLTGEADFRLLGGYFRSDATHRRLFATLLPAAIHIRATDSFALIVDEVNNERPGRELIVERLVEVMLVEALRFQQSDTGDDPRPGLLAGLADPALARVLEHLHDDVARPWTVAQLAREAAMSRSVFSERFTRTLGLPPMEYLQQWRMAIARDLLQREDPPLEKVAAAIGYESASAFSTAFRRRMGMSPSRFARASRMRAPA